MFKKKRFWVVLCAVAVLILGLYFAAMETETGDMYILSKNENSFGGCVLTVAKDGAGAVFKLSCTPAQYDAVEIGELVTCRWKLNLVTHRGHIIEVYEGECSQ